MERCLVSAYVGAGFGRGGNLHSETGWNRKGTAGVWALLILRSSAFVAAVVESLSHVRRLCDPRDCSLLDRCP